MLFSIGLFFIALIVIFLYSFSQDNPYQVAIDTSAKGKEKLKSTEVNEV